MSYINDNVFHNLDHISLADYDKSSLVHKTAFTNNAKWDLCGKIATQKTPLEQNENIALSVNKILLAHRNTKLFLIMMSGPFFLFLYSFKYIGRFAVLYWLYKKS